MYSCEGIGKNIEQAIENALFELKVSREDVDIKILNEGGFLKKAKVLVTISEDAVEKYEKKNALKKAMNEEVVETSEVKEPKAEVAEEAKTETIQKTEPVEVALDDEDDEDEIENVKEQKHERKAEVETLLNEILKTQNLTAEISKTEDDRYVHYMLTGENLNSLIGYHGEALYALSSYLSLVCKTPNHKKVILDINDYRAKRADTLRELAEKVANKVAKSGRYYKFDPMDASERKAIHTALQNDSRVTTMSKGEEPHRYLMVFPVDSETV